MNTNRQLKYLLPFAKCHVSHFPGEKVQTSDSSARHLSDIGMSFSRYL